MMSTIKICSPIELHSNANTNAIVSTNMLQTVILSEKSRNPNFIENNFRPFT